MKTRTALASALSAGLALVACNKAADTLAPSESTPTGTATLAARLAAASPEAAKVLRQTKTVRATLDTGSAEASLVPLAPVEVEYSAGKVSFPALRVGVSYVLKLEGRTQGNTLWSVTRSGTVAAAGSAENSPKLDVALESLNLKAPTISVSGTTATLASTSDPELKADLYWTRDTTTTWTQGATVDLDKPDVLWAKDSVEGIASSAWTPLVIAADGTVKQETLEAPAISLLDPTGDSTAMEGWAKLVLTDNAAGKGTLQYSLDSASWKSWSDTVRLFGTGTVYARSYKSGAHGLVSKQAYVVTPLILPAPSVAVDSSKKDSSILTLTSNFKLGLQYPGAALYYSTVNGASWTRYTAPVKFTTTPAGPILVMDSLVGQTSVPDTVKVTIRNTARVTAPTVSVATAYGSNLFVTSSAKSTTGGLTASKAGTNGIDTLKTISASCPDDLKIQYRPSSATSWTDGTPSNLTKADSIYFRCALNATSFSEPVPALFRILQRPALSIRDSSFYGSLRVKIANDSPSLLGQATGETYNYCIESIEATGCTSGLWKTAKAGDTIALDTSAKLWVNRQWIKGDSTWASSSTMRTLTKLQNKDLATSGMLSFTTDAADSGKVRELYGAILFTSSATTSTLSAANGTLAMTSTWAMASGEQFNAFSGLLLPLTKKWDTLDLSQVASLQFTYRTSDTNSVLSLIPIHATTESPVGVNFKPSLKETVATISLASWGSGVQKSLIGFDFFVFAPFKSATVFTYPSTTLILTNVKLLDSSGGVVAVK